MVTIRRLIGADVDFPSQLAELLHRDQADTGAAQIREDVADIIAAVRRGGDVALAEFTQQFDGYSLDPQAIQIPQREIDSALQQISPTQRSALEYAADRITRYHQHQLEESWQYSEPDGTTLGQKITPLQRVGLYVPGGKAAYPSSVLMNAIPAKVAGVRKLVMTTPTPSGETNAMVLAAAAIAGVDEVYRVGGAHAIAALAFGTETISAVDKITGPGNAWVAAAKQQVFGHVGIDMIAGPSEVLIIADSTSDPQWVAMDMFAQAEHDELAQAILLTTDQQFATAVQDAIEQLLPTMERRDIIAASLQDNGAIIVASDQQQIVTTADTIAAEHLEIFTDQGEQLAQQISHAGAIFIGHHSAESLGDYCAGPNHVLPTSGTARFSSPLGVYDFVKRTSMIKISPQGAHTMAAHAAELAYGESLTAHARSAELRRKS